ncbi:MAG TPA: hypothetical protein VIM65_06910 [Cyclobacteriaceae bacterium]
MRIPLLLFVSGFIGVCCTQPPSDRKELIVGSWKTDSVYTYYNGFGFTRTDMEETPLQHYQADGKLKMTREDETRFFFYSLPATDSLIQQTLDRKNLGSFKILLLDENKLILKKIKSPLFSGKNQERFEVRYFSRIK